MVCPMGVSGRTRRSTLGVRAAVAFVVVGIAAVAASVGYSTLTGGSNAVNACYSKKTGAVRIITSGRCKSAEYAITWNKSAAGQAGKPGPPGPHGPAGA